MEEVQERKAELRMRATVPPCLGFAMAKNGLPLVEELLVENLGEAPLEGAWLRMEFSEAFASFDGLGIDRLEPGQSLSLRSLPLRLDAGHLAQRTEGQEAWVDFVLEKQGRVLARETASFRLLAFDECFGFAQLPQLLAAFVTPNHPVVQSVLRAAADVLGGWTGDPSLDAYASQDEQRVRLQAAAVYTALQRLHIAYAVAPASFEPAGQRVRLLDVLEQERLGNCLDLTLFYAACLEAAGLHPLLVLLEGHAFAGLWLQEGVFAETVQDDASALVKRAAEGVLALSLVETTGVCQGRNLDFEQAEALALRQMKAGGFLCAVDVARARTSGIRPLPQRVRGPQGWSVAQGETPAPEQGRKPGQRAGAVSPPQSEETRSRLDLWQRRLLDLSLRNSLLNLRPGKSAIPLLCPALAELEDALSGGEDFALLPRLQEAEGRQAAELGPLLLVEFAAKRLRCGLSEEELAKRCTRMYRSARVSLEESGANSLYLAMGLLRWFETAASVKERLAPIVLLPVELARRAGGKGYVLRLRDEEPQMNVTLLESLRQGFGVEVAGLDPLPQDEKGVDLQAVFSILRQAVLHLPRWEVEERAVLGIFSFAQFVMWNDLRNRAGELGRSKIVRSLLENKLSWLPEPLEAPEDLEAELALPIPADSSQLAAAYSAAKGRSFVLHGPPGTGKSQTITNMIAGALGQGKTVLFVAEKQAALQVVQRRLEAIGLAPFCLELHSSKSRKRDVLEELQRAIEVGRDAPPEGYAALAERLAGLRAQLNASVSALHQKRRCGLSLYETIARYEQHRHAPDCLQMPAELAARLDGEGVAAQQALVEELLSAAEEAGTIAEHPLRGIGQTEYSQTLRMEAPGALEAYERALDGLCAALKALAKEAGLPAQAMPENARRMEKIAALLQRACELPEAYLRLSTPGELLEPLQDYCRKADRAAGLRLGLSRDFREELFSLPGADLAREWRELEPRWALPRALGRNRLKKALLAVGKGKRLEDARAAAALSALEECQGLEAACRTLSARLPACVLPEGNEYEQALDRLRARMRLAEELEPLAQGQAERLLPSARALAERAGAYREAYRTLEEAGERVERLFRPLQGTFLRGEEAAAACAAQSERWRQALPELRPYVRYLSLCARARAQGLEFLVQGLEQGLPLEQAKPAYLRALYRALALCIFGEEPLADRFSGKAFEQKVKSYQALDARFRQLTQQQLRAQLAARVPDLTLAAAQSSEVSILQRAIRSGGRGVSIRKLLSQLPSLLPRLCPCMLMSPLSAAQYLDPARQPFDLVLFDEASQLPTCKAVGVLARGKEAVVVGDPKQLPPTNFFAVQLSDEEDWEVEDLESILDDCLALSIPDAHLQWHYRSKHESLIAFSNAQFYDNRLLTFPSPGDRNSRVRFVGVEGVYDRGRTKQNLAEARAVTARILQRLRAGDGRSMGVVTFSAAQQNLIDDLLTEAFRDEPELEQRALQREEPLFIKNLENVQGDERDVVLFSVGYGPDQEGRVAMNFGPLNREGGWRRLNVAVSRAREEMEVFSTLQPEQLDFTRTSAQGVAALKRFLDYAKLGRLPAAGEGTEAREPDGLALAVAEALEAEGYRVERNIGRSGYRVDLGVRRQGEEKYLLGVLLDGKTYAAAQTAYDRDISREGVLRRLGWQLEHVWALDWWDNPKKERERLLERLKRLEAAEEAPSPQEEEPVAPLAQRGRPQVPATPAEAETPRRTSDKRRRPYAVASLSNSFLEPEAFVSPQVRPLLRAKLGQVIRQEGPVAETVLYRRVLKSCGIARAGTRIQKHLQQLLDSLGARRTQEGETVFYSLPGQGLEPGCYRVATQDEDSRREAKEWPAEEIAAAAQAVLEAQFGLPEDDLLRETAKLMGFGRLGPAMEVHLRLGLRRLFEEGLARKDGRGRVMAVEPAQGSEEKPPTP